VQLTSLGRVPENERGAESSEGNSPAAMVTALSDETAGPGDKQFTQKRPTVVFIHGFGCCSLEFFEVSHDVSRRTGLPTFTYERVSLGSGVYEHPRTAMRLVEELVILLGNRKVQPPYLLVGHSYGGLIARCFAISRPNDVAGLVLIDPAHEDQFKHFPFDMTMAMNLSPAIMRFFWLMAPMGLVRLLDSFDQAPFPPLYLYNKETRGVARELYSKRSTWGVVLSEWKGTKLSFKHMASFQKDHFPMRKGLPCTVIIAADRKHSPTLHPQSVTKAFEKFCRPIVEEVGGKIIMAGKSDHWVHLQSPTVVVDAICDVYTQIKESNCK